MDFTTKEASLLVSKDQTTANTGDIWIIYRTKRNIESDVASRLPIPPKN